MNRERVLAATTGVGRTTGRAGGTPAFLWSCQREDDASEMGDVCAVVAGYRLLFVCCCWCLLFVFLEGGGGGGMCYSQLPVPSAIPITEYIPLIFVTPPNKSGLSHFACSFDLFTVRSHL